MFSTNLVYFPAFTFLFSLATLTTANIHHQHPLMVPKTWRIAIIGAGPSGASTAYYIQQSLPFFGPNAKITCYDQGSEAGGRVQTVDVYDVPTIKAELGAPFFNTEDETFMDIAFRYGLPVIRRRDIVPGRGVPWAVWNGKEFVYEQNGQEGGYWDMAKLVWKYGASPIKTSELVKQYMHEFRRMFSYDDPPGYPYPPTPPNRPPNDGDDEDHVELKEAFEEYGKAFFESRGVSLRFLQEIVEPRTRMARAQGLKDLHAFAAMESIRDSGQGGEQVFIENGNWQIFYAMLHSSGAAVELNTRVLNITQRTEEAGFWITTSSTVPTKNNSGEDLISRDAYDAVVIATPFFLSNITLGFPLTQPPANETYLPMHSTFFTSPYPHLSPVAFNLPSASMLPTNILTTSGPLNVTSSTGSDDDPGFLSARVLRNATRYSDGIEITEYVFRIDSRDALSNEVISSLSGIPALSSGKPGVTWLRRHVWENAFVHQEPKGWFKDVEIAPSMYYVSGMSRVWDGMEASMLMGKQVGRLLADLLQKQS